MSSISIQMIFTHTHITHACAQPKNPHGGSSPSSRREILLIKLTFNVIFHMNENSSLATHSLGNRSRTISLISTATDSTDFVTCSDTFTIILHVFLYIYICICVYIYIHISLSLSLSTKWAGAEGMAVRKCEFTNFVYRHRVLRHFAH